MSHELRYDVIVGCNRDLKTTSCVNTMILEERSGRWCLVVTVTV